MDKGGREVGQPMWIIFRFYNIILKSANVDKGGRGTLIHKMWIKRFFLSLPKYVFNRFGEAGAVLQTHASLFK